MDIAWRRKINQEYFIVPAQALIKLRELEIEVARSKLAPKVKALRTNALKRERELREACLFCYGVACRQQQPIHVIPIEEADFDFVASWVVDKTRHLAPVQLKEGSRTPQRQSLIARDHRQASEV